MRILAENDQVSPTMFAKNLKVVKKAESFR